MHCPYCRSTDTRVLDSRVADDGSSIRRRRQCTGCSKRFTTVEQMQLTVLKRSGATEPFTREKAVSGVRKACKGRPVTEDQLACLGQAVEDALRGSQVCLSRDEGAYAIVQALIARGVVGDFRAGDAADRLPDILRFGVTPLYTRFVDVWDAVEHLRQVLSSGEWREARFHQRGAVT